MQRTKTDLLGAGVSCGSGSGWLSALAGVGLPVRRAEDPRARSADAWAGAAQLFLATVNGGRNEHGLDRRAPAISHGQPLGAT